MPGMPMIAFVLNLFRTRNIPVCKFLCIFSKPDMDCMLHICSWHPTSIYSLESDMKRMTHFSIFLDLRSLGREGGMKNRRKEGWRGF